MAPPFNPGPFSGQQAPNPLTQQGFRPYDPFAGLPGAGSLHSILQMFGHDLPGMSRLPVGLGGNPNLYNNWRYQQFQAEHQTAMQQAIQSDTTRALQAARGLADWAGQPLSTEATANITAGMEAFSGMGELMSSPSVLRGYNTILGGRSAAPISHYVHAGSRGHRDPRTGMTGLSGRSSAEVAGLLQQHYFAGGNQTDFSRSGGLDSAEFGEMYQALASSARLPPPDSKMQNWGKPESLTKMKETLTSYSRILGTMKEIFVSEGKGNAPMQQLLEAADSLTGGLQQMSAKQAETRIRGVYDAAKNAGLGMPAIMAGMQMNSAVAQAYGVNETFALPVTQFGLEFRNAANGMGIQRTSAYGSVNDVQMQRAAEANQIGFVASASGNTLGMFHRMLQQRYGGADGTIDASKITGNDPAARAARAIAANDLNNPAIGAFINQNERDVITQTARVTGMRTGDVGHELTMRFRNEEQINKYDLQMGAGGAIRQELMERIIRPGMTAEAGRRLEGMIGGGRGAGALAQRLGGVASSALDKMDADTYRSEVARNIAGGLAIRESLAQTAKGRGPEAEAARRTIKQIESSPLGADRGYAEFYGGMYQSSQQNARDSGVLRDPVTGRADAYVNALDRTSPELMAATKAERDKNTRRGELAGGAMGAIDSQGFVGRFMSEMAEAGRVGPGKDPKSQDEILKAVQKSMGVTITSANFEKMKDIGERLTRGKVEIEKEYDRISAMGASPAADREMKNLQRKIKTNADLSKEFTDIINSDKDMKARFEKLTGEAAAEEGKDKVALSMGNVTINVNGDPLVRDAAAEVKQNESGAGATA